MSQHYYLLHVTVLTILLKFVSTQYYDELVNRESLEVKPGSNSCISNCSHIASRGNHLMHCAIQECENLPEIFDAAQPPEIDNSEDIYFEKYTDEKDMRDKLALNIRWSPVDNVSIEKTKGYVVRIEDGNSSYHMCYNITTLMNFQANSLDYYYNDCFGKMPGTYVKPGSEIHVRITTLPLALNDKNYGTITRRIQVPNCTNEELHSLLECATPGGRPTTKPCISETCHSQSHMNGETHHINCTLSKREKLSTSNAPEKCHEVNRTISGNPTAARHYERDQEWYKFFDEETGDIKVALNFSWVPSPDSGISSLHKYSLEIVSLSKPSTVFHSKCYSIHTKLNLNKHANVVFYYDCYGRETGRGILPGEKYHINIVSLPMELNSDPASEQFTVTVPDCYDDRMKDVTYCLENSKDVQAKIEEIYCQNNSIKLSYNILSSDENLKADILSCPSSGNRCTGRTDRMQEDLQLSGTLYNISFPSHVDKTSNISVFVQPAHKVYLRKRIIFSFSGCVEEPDNSNVMTIIFVIVGLVVIAMVALICYVCRNCKYTKGLLARCLKSQDRASPIKVSNDTRANPGPSDDAKQDEIPSIPNKMRVYVIFMDDHEYHRNVVHWFCSYLKQDLGLDVRLNIWTPEEVAVNPTNYMKTNIKLAEKVIIICSEGTKHCMKKTEYDGDMFTPVITEVVQCAFLGKDPGKFLVGYFPYSKPDHVPALLHDQCLIYFSLFKLMKQFEEMYFRLVDIEQFRQGMIYRIDKIAYDRYYDPNLTSCGLKLRESIDHMVEFVENYPTWYTDKSGSDLPISNIPPQPILHITSPRSPQSNLVSSIIPGQASIQYMVTNPPPALPDGCLTNNNLQPNSPRAAIIDEEPRFSKARQAPVAIKLHNPPAVRKRGNNYPRLKSSDSSFALEEAELDSYIPGQNITGSPTEERDYYYVPQSASSNDCSEANHSVFLAESFNDQDFKTIDCDEDSIEKPSCKSSLNQVKIIGLSASQEQLAKLGQEQAPNDFDDQQKPTDALVPPPLAGVFNLANLEDSVEDFEVEFKSINLSKFKKNKVNELKPEAEEKPLAALSVPIL